MSALEPQQCRGRHRCHGHAQQCHRTEGRCRAPPPAEHPGADQRGKDATDGESGVERGHDGPLVAALDLHGMGVHADIQTAVPETEHQQCRPQRPDARGPSRQDHGRTAQGRAERYDGAGAEAVGQGADDLHTGKGSRTEQQQEPAEHGMADPYAMLDTGDMDDPHPHQEAVQDEVGEGGQSTDPQ